ncbi:hypothetical protein G6F37_000314 [Rhizopus arrhizus]|nr:hypothetical protein G6F38_001435 [Rhizopus arrhizus]KAG1164403.1 hypothetical protein G6F37_000314 [Rhizopus arrhizus]
MLTLQSELFFLYTYFDMSNLQQLVTEKFKAAKESKAVFSFETTEIEKESNGINFQITLVPALAKKPQGDDNKEKTSPFINPNPDLLVKELDEHLLLLNKFAVIPNHMLVVTKEQKSQTEPPFPNDLYEVFKIIKEFGSSQPLLAFYNCGENSGASQAHKHVQIIPLKTNGSVQPPIKKVYDEIHDRHVGQIYAINRLPFVHVIMQLDTNIIRAASKKEDLTDYLSQMFFGLLDAMFQQLRENSDEFTTSYNFLMTEEFMMLVPRQKEKATFRYKGEEMDLSMNSLAFAGMILCKGEEQLEALKENDIMDLLSQVGIKWNENQKLDAERQMASEAHLA